MQSLLGRSLVGEGRQLPTLHKLEYGGCHKGGLQPIFLSLNSNSYEDLLYYQKIIKALVLTDKIMQEIDKILGDRL